MIGYTFGDPEKLSVTVHVSGEIAGEVNQDLLRFIAEAAEIMVRKNTERGDCWRATGMVGGFVELHSCYNRLRELIWRRRPKMDDDGWKRDVKDCCQDLRNFSTLIELALAKDVYDGDDDIEKHLECPSCGGRLTQ